MTSSAHTAPVHVLPRGLVPVVALVDPVLEQLDEGGDVVELCLLQHPLLAHRLVQHELAVAQEVQHRHEVGGVAVDHEGAGLVLTWSQWSVGP